MWNELIQVRTKDGVVLHGALFPPGKECADARRVAICVHGTGSNFYSSTLFDSITKALHSLGVSVLRVNTRGHDGVSTAATPHGGKRIGAAFEIVDDCRYDLAAWLRLARDRRAEEVTLIGHSMGAVKSLYAAPKLAVERVVAVSPPRLSHGWFSQGPHASKFHDVLAQAQSLVDSGNGEQLLDIDFPLPMLISAASYIDKYGPSERYDFLNDVPKLAQPTLFTFGSVEVERNWAFQGLPEAVASAATADQPIAVETVSGADHFYTDRREQLCSILTGWLGESQG